MAKWHDTKYVLEVLSNNEHTSYYLIGKELIERGHKVDFPFWPNKTMLVTIGNGQPFLIKGVTTPNSSDVIRHVSYNKYQTYKWAEYLGLSVLPFKRYVKEQWAAEFWDIHNGEVVIKPMSGQRGEGIQLNFKNKEDFLIKARASSQKYPTLLQKKCSARVDLRLLYIDGAFIAATIRKPTILIGDGRSTMSILVEHENALRTAFNLQHDKALLKKNSKKILNIQDVASFTSISPKEVIPKSVEVQVSLANVSDGGITEDVTSEVHEGFIRYGTTIAKSYNVPLVAVDFLVTDHRSDINDINSACFLETNVNPGIRIQQYPHIGHGPDITAYFVNYLEKQYSS